MTIRQRRKWIAAVFGLLSALLVAAAIWIDRRGLVLTAPIRLTSDFRLQSAFEVPRKAYYRVSVYCSRAAETRRLKELLQGGNLVEIALAANGGAVPLHLFPEPVFRPFSLSTAEDLDNIVVGRNGAGQDIAGFAGDPSKAYQITCSIIRPVAELDQMNPRLLVALDPLPLEAEMMLSALLVSLAIGTTVVAVVATIYYFAYGGTGA
jgi:hypothetical protein